MFGGYDYLYGNMRIDTAMDIITYWLFQMYIKSCFTAKLHRARSSFMFHFNALRPHPLKPRSPTGWYTFFNEYNQPTNQHQDKDRDH